MSQEFLFPAHREHLLSEGFTVAQIQQLIECHGVRSLTPAEALTQGFKAWNGQQWQSSAGILFPFSKTFAQLRCDTPLQRQNGKPAKYLTPVGKPSEAFIPEGCRVVTEGFKDALAGTLRGGIPTGAIAGVSHYRKALPEGCGYTIVFDADGWANPQVLANLIHAGKWCGGRVLILPEMAEHPKGGLCEFFRSGYGARDYEKLLLDGALTPEELLEEWPNQWGTLTPPQRVKCARMAAKLARLYLSQSEARAYIRRLTDKHRDSGITISDLKHDAERHIRAREGKSSKEKRKTIAEQLVEIGKTATLWHSPEPDLIAYADVMVGTARHTYRIRSTDFKRWLARQLYEKHDQAANSEALNTALTVLEGEAIYAGAEMQVFCRVAEYQGRHYLDLGTSDWSAVEYGADGWRVVAQPPVRFVRSRCSAPLPIPTRGGTLHQIFDLVNVTEDDRPLILGFLLKTLIPEGTEPILILHGEQGSGKSAGAECLKRLTDPAKPIMLKTVSDVRTVGIFAAQNRVILYDNLSHLTPESSDLLCSMATGGGHAERTLNTDNDLTLFEFKRPQILTGIDEIATRGDLLDRALTIELEPIAGGAYLSETEYRQRFDAMHPQLLGALLDAVCVAIANKSKTPQPVGTRMVDFAHLAIAVEAHLGYETGTFLERLLENKRRGHEISTESSPVAIALSNFLNTRWDGRWTGSPTELLEALNRVTDEQTRRKALWPATPRALGKALKRVAPNLRALGVTVEQGRAAGGNRERIYTIARSAIGTLKMSQTSRNVQPNQGQDFTRDVSDNKTSQVGQQMSHSIENVPNKTTQYQCFQPSRDVWDVWDIFNVPTADQQRELSPHNISDSLEPIPEQNIEWGESA